jgi:hypothetical protein
MQYIITFAIDGCVWWKRSDGTKEERKTEDLHVMDN